MLMVVANFRYLRKLNKNHNFAYKLSAILLQKDVVMFHEFAAQIIAEEEMMTMAALQETQSPAETRSLASDELYYECFQFG